MQYKYNALRYLQKDPGFGTNDHMARAGIQIASHEVTFAETFVPESTRETREEYHAHAHYFARGRARKSGVFGVRSHCSIQ